MRVLILGGGGFRVPLICRELASSGLPVSEVVLYDVAPERLGVIAAVLAAGGLPLRTTTDLDTALLGADVIFAALRVGGLEGRVADERSALDAGVIGQETVGAGGLSYAARVVPVADAIARRVAELAPRAWVISMTNPAGIVTEVMAATLGPRVIGVCDSPMGLVRRACAAAGVDPGSRLAQVPDGVEVDYLGLNHLGWLRGLRVDGSDRLPGLLADPAALQRTEEGRLFGPDLLQALGAIPNEYLYWYYARAEALRDSTRGRADASRARPGRAAAVLRRRRGGSRPGRRPVGRGQRRAQPQLFRRAAFGGAGPGRRRGGRLRDHRDRARRRAHRNGPGRAAGPARLILNVRNGGTVPALEPDTVIETVCQVDGNGALPLPAPPPTGHELGLMSTVKSCERAIASAALTGSAADALRAFALHPLVGSLDAARTLSAAALARARDHGAAGL